VGRPNVGKSTLLNAALHERLAIVTPTPQTTRDRILGVVRHGNAQIALVDTPGLHKARSGLGRQMNAMARNAAREADVVVFVTAVPPRPKAPLTPFAPDLTLLSQLDSDTRTVLVINKIDLCHQKTDLMPLLDAYAKLSSISALVPTCALTLDGVSAVLDEVAELLPERGPAYDEDFLTDRPVRFLASELIREQIILSTRDEVPHHVAVAIEGFDEAPDIVRIRATVRCAREGQRGILIGKRGEKLKSIGTAARIRIEQLLERRVHLELWVTTQQGWIDSQEALDALGYLALPSDHGGTP
jgi:GTP-binding protein Era